MYKLTILFDTENEECETLCETVDVFNDNKEVEGNLLTIEDYEDKGLRDFLIEAQLMGDA